MQRRKILLWAIPALLALSQLSVCQVPSVDPLSVASLRLTIRHDAVDIGTATGFVLNKGQNHYLVTNRHVVLACVQDKNPNNVGGWLCANKLEIVHNKLGRLGEWLPMREELYDPTGKNKRWLEHPRLGSSADIVALPLTQTREVAFFPVDLELRKTQMVLVPGDPLSIVGFPMGLGQFGGLAIWKTGMLASDFDIDIGNRPTFLLDTTATSGMSGSPVYARRQGMYQAAAGVMQAGNATKFLGVYAEQSKDLEIGLVWKAEIVQGLYESLP